MMLWVSVSNGCICLLLLSTASVLACDDRRVIHSVQKCLNRAYPSDARMAVVGGADSINLSKLCNTGHYSYETITSCLTNVTSPKCEYLSKIDVDHLAKIWGKICKNQQEMSSQFKCIHDQENKFNECRARMVNGIRQALRRGSEEGNYRITVQDRLSISCIHAAKAIKCENKALSESCDQKVVDIITEYSSYTNQWACAKVAKTHLYTKWTTIAEESQKFLEQASHAANQTKVKAHKQQRSTSLNNMHRFLLGYNHYTGASPCGNKVLSQVDACLADVEVVEVHGDPLFLMVSGHDKHLKHICHQNRLDSLSECLEKAMIHCTAYSIYEIITEVRNLCGKTNEYKIASKSCFRHNRDIVEQLCMPSFNDKSICSANIQMNKCIVQKLEESAYCTHDQAVLADRFHQARIPTNCQNYYNTPLPYNGARTMFFVNSVEMTIIVLATIILHFKFIT